MPLVKLLYIVDLGSAAAVVARAPLSLAKTTEHRHLYYPSTSIFYFFELRAFTIVNVRTSASEVGGFKGFSAADL